MKHKTDQKIIDAIEESLVTYRSTAAFKYRDYQSDIIETGTDILLANGFVYLAMEVRTGKTVTSLGIADRACAKNVLFITKKKGIGSIENDYKTLSPSFFMQVINYDSLHKVKDDKLWDLVIIDEAHSLSAAPIPSERAKMVKGILERCDPMVILLSGTPTPESYSQMYHQVYGIRTNPFNDCANFYKFAHRHIKIKEKKINGVIVRDYTEGLPTIMEAMQPYMITYTQAEAGFVSEIVEEVDDVVMKQSTYDLISKLEKTLVIEGKGETILADTPVKLMTKLHQLYSGTIKFESGNSMVLDTSKAEYIYSKWGLDKIAIFYKFKEELEAIKKVYEEWITTDLNKFNTTEGMSIALQIVSGREAISLKNAEVLVYYNIDFSATSYWQSRDRMTTIDRTHNKVHWVFAKDGIEYDIYKTVLKKKDYTLSHFKKRL
jgi:hypothetical protein